MPHTGDGPQHCAAGHSHQQAGQPAPAQTQRRVQAQCHAEAVLARSADVEQAHLIGKQDGQRAHQQRCGLDQRVAQIFQLGGCLFIGQEVFDHSKDRLAGASGIDDQQHEIAEEQTQHDAQKRGQQRLEAVALENILFHAFTSSLLAPAM